MNRIIPLLLVSGLVACSSSEGSVKDEDPSNPWVPGKGDQVGDGAAGAATDAAEEQVRADWHRDILTTDLAIDLEARTGSAKIRLAASESSAASFETKGLQIKQVSGAGGPLRYLEHDGQLDVEVPAQAEPIELTIEYGFSVQNKFDGYLSSGLTFLWPYFCSNLFPCKSAPDDGVRFSMDFTGLPADKQAVYPKLIPADAPSYMPAIAIGSYTYEPLGTTGAGTQVGVWYQSGEKQTALAGTTYLAGIFDWFETTYGPYTFGKDVASVSATWGPGAYGGMEHHPYWHVAKSAMAADEVHVHEAGHGWFGDGVRIRCWEDFVLSEGTTTYITARGFEAVGGAAEGEAIWAQYRDELEAAVAQGDTAAWPDKGCNTIDILHDPLWSAIPYMKGAFFYKAVAHQVGVETLDNVLAHFYGLHVGKAAGMQDMLDLIQAETGFDATALSKVWLRDLGIPQ